MLNLNDNRIAGDLLSLAYTAHFLDDNAGVGKYVDVSLTLSGADAGNYVYNIDANAFAAKFPRCKRRATH